MRINKNWLFAAFLFAVPSTAFAQGAPSTRAMTVPSCGVQAFPLTDPSGKAAFAPLTQLQNGNLCTNGTGGGGGSTTPTTSTGAYAPATITTTSTQVLPAAGRVFLDLKNESTSQPIACSLGGTAAINTAGSFTIAPGGDKTWEGSFVPSDQVNCITSAGTAPLTVGAK